MYCTADLTQIHPSLVPLTFNDGLQWATIFESCSYPDPKGRCNVVAAKIDVCRYGMIRHSVNFRAGHWCLNSFLSFDFPGSPPLPSASQLN